VGGGQVRGCWWNRWSEVVGATTMESIAPASVVAVAFAGVLCFS